MGSEVNNTLVLVRCRQQTNFMEHPDLKRTCRYLEAVVRLNTHPLVTCALDPGLTSDVQLRSVSELLHKNEWKVVPFCFTLSNDTTRSDREPGKAEGAVALGCRCCGACCVATAEGGLCTVGVCNC